MVISKHNVTKEQLMKLLRYTSNPKSQFLLSVETGQTSQPKFIKKSCINISKMTSETTDVIDNPNQTFFVEIEIQDVYWQSFIKNELENTYTLTGIIPAEIAQQVIEIIKTQN